MAKAKKKIIKTVSQPKGYDKLIREGFEKSIPELIKRILKIDLVKRDPLPTKIELTKERDPDSLDRIITVNGETFVIHLEFQSTDDSGMADRMAEYWTMLHRKYKLPVNQYVFYLGEEKSKMQHILKSGKNYFEYELINISSIDYNTFLQSDIPEFKLLAILGNFGEDKLATALTRIINGVINSVDGNLNKEKIKNQLRGLAKLRNFTLDNFKEMRSVIIPFKKEDDIFYKVGQHEGYEAGQHEGYQAGQHEGYEAGQYEGYQSGQHEERLNRNTEFVTNLLLAGKFTVSEIANFASVDESFVKKVRRELKQKN
ncbi:MAG: hypothetical protein LBE82_12485 [Chitinophagaceae bacterium]|jgi:predicted transposase YdaD|nr:hypothetical protein [Chitinophagaceae bacterium]